LLPKGVENMLVACRAFSSDQTINNFFNLIPHCIAFGEAAGTAAALSLKQGVNLRNINFESLRKQLTDQNVPLPGNPWKNPKKGQGAAMVYQARAFGGPDGPGGPRPATAVPVL
jgi:hypothetical protein